MSLKDIKKLRTEATKKYKHGIVDANSNNLVHKIAFDSPQLTNQFSGFSYDRIHQLFGPYSSGKSSLSTYIGGQLQKKMPIEMERLASSYEAEGDKDKAAQFRKDYEDKYHLVYLDFERTFDPEYAEKLGLNCDEDHFTLIQADSVEDGFQIAESMVKSGSICCVVFDSDAMATSNLDNESEMGATGFNGAKNAITLSTIYKKFNVLCANYLTPLIVISQETTNMNVMAHLPNQTGGQKIRFAATTRNRVTQIEQLKEGSDNVGIKIRVRNYKNKAGIPWRDAEMNLFFDKGFDSDSEYFDFLVSFGFINKSGGWYDAADIGMPKVQGAAKVQEWLKEHPDVYEDLKKKIDGMLMVKNTLDDNNSDPTTDDIKELSKNSGKTVEELAIEALEIQKKETIEEKAYEDEAISDIAKANAEKKTTKKSAADKKEETEESPDLGL